MQFTPGWRKFALAAHITSSVGWFGAVVAFLGLAMVGVQTASDQMVQSVYIAMEALGWLVIVPFSVASLITGLVQSAGTLTSSHLRDPRMQLLGDAAAAAFVLMIAIGLSVFKPRGRTSFGDQRLEGPAERTPTTLARFEAEYEMLITNRLVLQPLVELNLYGKSIPERGIGAGLSAPEAGLRLRYEVRREVAPYVGIVWHREFGGTADFSRQAGHDIGGWRLAAGFRTWF